MAFVTHAARLLAPSRRQCINRHFGAGAICMGRRSAKIANRKGKQTAARTKVFARIGKQIVMAVKRGGADVTVNRELAMVLDTARLANVPKETTNRAIQRASNPNQDDYKESVFEIYGLGGTAILVNVTDNRRCDFAHVHSLSDNMNRAAGEIRAVANRNQMKIASPGSVSFNFDRMGVILIPAENVSDGDQLLEAAIEAGAEECDLDDDNEFYRIVTVQSGLSDACKALGDSGYTIESAALEMIAKTTVSPSDEEMEQNIKAIELLEELDDVDGVYSNME